MLTYNRAYKDLIALGTVVGVHALQWVKAVPCKAWRPLLRESSSTFKWTAFHSNPRVPVRKKCFVNIVTVIEDTVVVKDV